MLNKLKLFFFND